jgi:drug/metabolite transporter (DMT)-like permease
VPVPADLLAAAGGLLAATFWGAGDFGGGIAAKRLPVFLAVLGAQVVGLVGALAAAALVGEPVPTPTDAAWAATAAVLGSVGLAGLYRALADGRMGIVAPITGVLAAAIPVAVGFAMAGLPGPVRLAGFGLAIVSIVLVSVADDGTTGRGGILMAVGAGVAFGLYSTCVGQVEEGIFAPLVVSRATSSLLVLVIVLAGRTPIRASFGGRPRLVGLVVLVGVLDLVGNASFLLAAQSGGLALAAVLGSLYPVATAILAAAILHERIGRMNAAGIAGAAVAAVLIVGGA